MLFDNTIDFFFYFSIKYKNNSKQNIENYKLKQFYT